MLAEFLWLLLVLSALLVAAVVAVVRRAGDIYLETEKPQWRSCKECDGCGVVVTGTGPIPLEHRKWYRSRNTSGLAAGHIQGPLANIESCLSCQGLGFRWHYSSQGGEGIMSIAGD